MSTHIMSLQLQDDLTLAIIQVDDSMSGVVRDSLQRLRRLFKGLALDHNYGTWRGLILQFVK